MPEVGHSHLRPCPTCRGTGYMTAHQDVQNRGDLPERRSAHSVERQSEREDTLSLDFPGDPQLC